jgi:error-prone DNA polymerase
MAASRSTRPVMTGVPPSHTGVGGAVHVYATGFRASPYADVKPAGEGTKAPRRLWHSSSGSAGG